MFLSIHLFTEINKQTIIKTCVIINNFWKTFKEKKNFVHSYDLGVSIY